MEKPSTSTAIPTHGIKHVGELRAVLIHEARVVRLFEVLLHSGPQIGGWTGRQIHHAVLTSFDLSEKACGLNHLRYDLRKLKGHGLIERDGSRYAYRLSQKGIQLTSSSCSS